MANQPLTPKQLKQAQELRKAGVSTARIARDLGVDYQYLYRQLIKGGQ